MADLDDLLRASPSEVGTLAQHLQTVADAIRGTNDQLKSVNSSDFWDGDAAEAFDDLKGELPPLLDIVLARYQTASSALGDYIEPLRDAQDRARQAVRDIEEAEADLARAEQGVDDMEAHDRAEESRARAAADSPQDTPYQSQPYPGPNYRALRGEAQQNLEAAEGRLEQAVADYKAASGTASGRIRDAADDDIRNGRWTTPPAPARGSRVPSTTRSPRATTSLAPSTTSGGPPPASATTSSTRQTPVAGC